MIDNTLVGKTPEEPKVEASRYKVIRKTNHNHFEFVGFNKKTNTFFITSNPLAIVELDLKDAKKVAELMNNQLKSNGKDYGCGYQWEIQLLSSAQKYFLDKKRKKNMRPKTIKKEEGND